MYLVFEVFQERGFWGNAVNFLSRFTDVYPVSEVFQTKVALFCFCLVRINMPLLMCCHMSWHNSRFELI